MAESLESPPSVVGAEAQDACRCCVRPKRPRPWPRRVRLHAEEQDTSAPGWLHLLTLIDEAAADGRALFRPLAELSPSERRDVITLPPSIATLTEVEHFDLYGSNLVRIPPEIGEMASLTEFTPYRSYRLHWFPYEITRCTRLIRSTVSTRALYGNATTDAPFPDLPAASPGWPCGVCTRPIGTEAGHPRTWVRRLVGTDVVPLLLNACSAVCVRHG
ncbi:leucine-rich repeat domain-containing protein [Embleya sp. AB8]|uniref:leucine-rich repeat domain-containing protein n=1 Tax=Embleya sp. AB8 TaxID=3156304 RepID=UPI003C755A3F